MSAPSLEAKILSRSVTIVFSPACKICLAHSLPPSTERRAVPLLPMAQICCPSEETERAVRSRLTPSTWFSHAYSRVRWVSCASDATLFQPKYSPPHDEDEMLLTRSARSGRLFLRRDDQRT